MIWVLIIGIIILFLCFQSYIKRLRFGNLTLISGGVKRGKTQLAVCLCVKTYKKQLGKWKRKRLLARIQKQPEPEKPLLYSNMPLAKIPYVPLTLDLVCGKTRFRYGSVVYYNECSLIAGSKDIKDDVLNDWLLQFFKLIAHETRGGYLFLDTQAPQDCHYTIKRSLSTYYYIYNRLTLPFFSLIWMRENMLVDGENTVAIDTQIDPQDSVLEGGKKMYFRIILNRWWKYYDQYAYSSLTDDLPVEDHQVKKKKNLKIKELIRCRNITQKLKKSQ